MRSFILRKSLAEDVAIVEGGHHNPFKLKQFVQCCIRASYSRAGGGLQWLPTPRVSVKEGWWYSVNWGIKRLRVQKCRSHHQIERCIAVTFAVSCTCICTHWVQISTSLTIINKRSVNIFSNIYWIFFGSAFLGIQETFCLRKIGTKFYPFSTNQNSLSVLSHFYPPSLHFYLTRTYIL